MFSENIVLTTAFYVVLLTFVFEMLYEKEVINSNVKTNIVYNILVIYVRLSKTI